ncbi:hypothetical protein QEN19_003398 [Hanseniaspora menglaensis]
MVEYKDPSSSSNTLSMNKRSKNINKKKALHGDLNGSKQEQKTKHTLTKKNDLTAVNKDLGSASSSSSSVFISSLSQNGSFSKKPRSFGPNSKKNKNNKGSNGKHTENKNNSSGNYSSDNEDSNISLHAYKIDQIKSTFQTSEDNIIRPKYNLNSKRSIQSTFKFTMVPQGKHLYTNFNGDSIHYSSILKLENYAKLIALDKKQGKRPFYFPFNDSEPCPIKFEYYVVNGKIPEPINCYFLSNYKTNAESISFKSCENKDLSIYFLLRILAADYDLIDRIISNLSNVAVHILKQIILSILKGWNIYLVCDVDLIRRCVDVFYKLRGFKMYYLNRPVISVIGFQKALTCKNCYNFASEVTKVSQDESKMEIEPEEESITIAEDVSSDATTDSDDESAIMDMILNESQSLNLLESDEISMINSEIIDPKALALDYLSTLQTGGH